MPPAVPAGNATDSVRRWCGIEIALALMLLVGAGLTLKNLTRLQAQYLGFRAEGVLRTIDHFLRLPLSDSGAEGRAFRRGAPAHRQSPRRGIRWRGGSPSLSLGGPGVRGARFEIFGTPATEARAEVYAANPAYLDAIRLPLLRGRWFTAADTLTSPAVAVLSDTVARRYPGRGEDCA